MKRQTQILLIIFFVILLIGIGVAFYYIYWKPKSNPNTQPSNCTATDKAALIQGFIQNDQRVPPCTAYPYINNLVVQGAQGSQKLYERSMVQLDTCCTFSTTDTTLVTNPPIFIEADVPITSDILNQNPYDYNPNTKQIAYILPPCNTTTGNACTAYINNPTTSQYKIYRIGGLTLDPKVTYPPPGSGANPDYPQPFSFNTLNVQILKDTIFIFTNGSCTNITYKGVNVTPPLANFPTLVQVLLISYCQKLPLAPTSGTNPPMVAFMFQ